MSEHFRRLLLNRHIDDLIHAGIAVSAASDLRFGEGPAYLPEQDAWIFSDIPNDRVLRFSENQGLSIALQPSQFANGHYPMPGGGFLSCEHLSRSVTQTHPDGTVTTVCASFDRRRLNSPNDVTIGPDGAIWFSDPTYGIISNVEGKRADSEQTRNRVYRVGQDGSVTAEIEMLTMPNGLAFAPDGKQLYVADSVADMGPIIGFDRDGPRDVYAFDIGQNNRVIGKPRHVYRATVGVPDGIRVDSDGFLWIATGGGVVCLDPFGAEVGIIETTSVSSNLSFGGKAGDRMMVTTENATFLVFS